MPWVFPACRKATTCSGMMTPLAHDSFLSKLEHTLGRRLRPCQSASPRKRNPRHGKGVNRWLPPFTERAEAYPLSSATAFSVFNHCGNRGHDGPHHVW